MKLITKIQIILASVFLFAVAAGAQTSNGPAAVNPAAAQSAGQAVLDSVPGLNILTNIPTTTFDLATIELQVGLENTGAQINNTLDLHYNFRTNFYVSGGITLGADINTINSAELGAGWRKGWKLWEVWIGAEGDRNFTFNNWEGGPVAGVAWKPVSGLAVYSQFETVFSGNTFSAPSKSLKFGIALPW